MFNSVINSIFQQTQPVVPSPSNETIYESQYSKNVNTAMQSTANYRYQMAQEPNPRNYVLPMYDRNDIYSKQVLDKSVLFSTAQPNSQPPQVFDPRQTMSPLTGQPMTMSFPNMETTMQIPLHKQDMNIENPSYARKMDRFTGTRDYIDSTVENSLMVDLQPQNIYQTQTHNDAAIQRAKDAFSEQRSMTNISASPKIYVPYRKQETIRVKPKTIDDLYVNPKMKMIPGRYGVEQGNQVGQLQGQVIEKNKRPTTFLKQPTDYNTFNPTGQQLTPLFTPEIKRKETLIQNTQEMNGMYVNQKGGKFNSEIIQKDNYVPLYSYTGNGGRIVSDMPIRNNQPGKIKTNKDYSKVYQNTQDSSGFTTRNAVNTYNKRNVYVDNPQEMLQDQKLNTTYLLEPRNKQNNLAEKELYTYITPGQNTNISEAQFQQQSTRNLIKNSEMYSGFSRLSEGNNIGYLDSFRLT